MAFDKTKFAPLSSLSNSDVPRIYGYTTTDSHNTVNNMGYFSDLHQVLRVGDMIVALANSEGFPPTSVIYFVTMIIDGMVDVSNGITSGSNSD